LTERNYKIKIREGNHEFEIEGDKDFVENYYIKIKKDFFKSGDIEHRVINKEASDLSLQNLSLIEFYKQKQPQNHNEIILVVADWLLNNENIEDFQPSMDILKQYDYIKLKKPSNIHQHISDLKDNGLIMPGEMSNSYKLTLKGIEFVENELPNIKKIKKK